MDIPHYVSLGETGLMGLIYNKTNYCIFHNLITTFYYI